MSIDSLTNRTDQAEQFCGLSFIFKRFSHFYHSGTSSNGRAHVTRHTTEIQNSYSTCKARRKQMHRGVRGTTLILLVDASYGKKHRRQFHHLFHCLYHHQDHHVDQQTMFQTQRREHHLSSPLLLQPLSLLPHDLPDALTSHTNAEPDEHFGGEC
jgi:hypothetical protein